MGYKVERLTPLKRIGDTIYIRIDGDTLDYTVFQSDIINNLNSLAFGADLLGIMTDPRILNVLCEDPSAGTLTDVSFSGHDGTYTGTWIAANRSYLGRAWKLEPNGTDAYISFGDHADFSFGDGANDAAFSILQVIEVDATAAVRTLASKWNETTGTEDREWKATLTSDHKAKLELFDESEAANQNPFGLSSALAAGIHLVGFTYSGIGGTDADDEIRVYVDGVLDTATRSGNQASYTAMEAGATPLWLMAFESTGGAASAFMTGDTALACLDGVELSAFDMWRIYQLCLSYYSEDGVTL